MGAYERERAREREGERTAQDFCSSALEQMTNAEDSRTFWVSKNDATVVLWKEKKKEEEDEEEVEEVQEEEG